jgi:hypothetical protein
MENTREMLQALFDGKTLIHKTGSKISLKTLGYFLLLKPEKWEIYEDKSASTKKSYSEEYKELIDNTSDSCFNLPSHRDIHKPRKEMSSAEFAKKLAEEVLRKKEDKELRKENNIKELILFKEAVELNDTIMTKIDSASKRGEFVIKMCIKYDNKNEEDKLEIVEMAKNSLINDGFSVEVLTNVEINEICLNISWW